MSRVVRKPFFFAYAKTKTQISFAVTAKLINAFVFATRIVQSLYFLNPKFQASSHLLWLYRPVCVGPGRKPRRLLLWFPLLLIACVDFTSVVHHLCAYISPSAVNVAFLEKAYVFLYIPFEGKVSEFKGSWVVKDILEQPIEHCAANHSKTPSLLKMLEYLSKL